MTEKECSREKPHRALLGLMQPRLLFFIIFPSLISLLSKPPEEYVKRGCTGKVEAKKAVSLATVATRKAGKSFLSHFSFHFLQLLKGGQMRCVKFTWQCLLVVPSVSGLSQGGQIAVQGIDCFGDFN